MIKLEDVSFSYPYGEGTLKNISVDFANHRCIGLIGASGSGKSTLLGTILGLNKPQQGTVWIGDGPLKYSKAALNHHFTQVGMVFQNPDDQIVHATVYDDVAYGCINMGMDLHKVAEAVTMALSAVDLTGFESRCVHHLSFGEKKRVAMAGILAMGHPTILLDEPTAGLDPQVTAHMVLLIQRLMAQGKRVLIASHDMDLIYHLCDRVWVLKNGALICDGAPRAVFMEAGLMEACGLNLPWLVALEDLVGHHDFRSRDQFLDFFRERVKTWK